MSKTTKITIDEFLCTGCGACHEPLPFLAYVMPGDNFQLTSRQTFMHKNRLKIAKLACKMDALIIEEEINDDK